MNIQKRTKWVFPFLLSGLMLFLFSAINTANAQNNESKILTMTEFTIKPGHSTAFQEGVKAWKECYLEADGEWTWSMWRRINGEGAVYSLNSFSDSWAEFDEQDESGRNCQTIVIQLIMPHIKSVDEKFAKTMPKWSPDPDSSKTSIIEVQYFRYKDYRLFNAMASEVNSIILKAEGRHRAVWYSAYGGGPGSYHYMAVSAHENFASLDKDLDSVWKVIEETEGAEKREELMDQFHNSVDEYWMYMYRFVEDLSHSGY